MDKEELQREDMLDSCNEIFSQFERDDATEGKLTLIGLFEWLLRPETDFLEDVVKESNLKFQDETAEDVFFGLLGMQMVLAFGIGYATGTLHDHDYIDPNIRKKIEAVRAIIKEKGIFYFAPRARA